MGVHYVGVRRYNGDPYCLRCAGHIREDLDYLTLITSDEAGLDTICSGPCARPISASTAAPRPPFSPAAHQAARLLCNRLFDARSALLAFTAANADTASGDDHDKSAFKALWRELDLRGMRIDSLELCQQGLQIDALLDFFESTFSDVRSEATGPTSNS
jgi:hypothetical protein